MRRSRRRSACCNAPGCARQTPREDEGRARGGAGARDTSPAAVNWRYGPTHRGRGRRRRRRRGRPRPAGSRAPAESRRPSSPVSRRPTTTVFQPVSGATTSGSPRPVGRLRLPRRPVQRAGDGARGHRQAEPLAQQGGRLRMREPELFVQDHDQRDRLRAQLHGRGAQRIRVCSRCRACTRRPHPPHRPIVTSNRRTTEGGDVVAVRTAAGSGTAIVIDMRRRRCRCRPWWRPARGAGVGAENGAAWRLAARRARSSACFSRSFSRRSRSRSRSTFARSRSVRSRSRRNRSFSRSRSRIGSERFGTSRLCQIPEKSTRGNVRYGRVNPVTSYPIGKYTLVATTIWSRRP